MSKYKEALESMVWQFAYRSDEDNEPNLSTGGLSALEEAFSALGWSDPKYFQDMDGCICDVEGCMRWVESQGCYWHETGYWLLCSKHSESGRKGDRCPPMKARAITREKSRDAETGFLPLLGRTK